MRRPWRPLLVCLAVLVLLSGCHDVSLCSIDDPTLFCVLIQVLGIFALGGRTSSSSVPSSAPAAEPTNGYSIGPALSADGLVLAFESSATNLDRRCDRFANVFVYSRISRQTTCVSLAPDGSPANGNSRTPRISGDGRVVVFQSTATNLVPGDTNGVADVFVHDLQTGQTTRVSVRSDGSQADGLSVLPVLSADGRVVAFESDGTNLVAGDTNGARDVFVHDRQSGQTTRASVAGDGSQGNDSSLGAALSADGRIVAFWSGATNLVPGDTNEADDVFVRDRQSGETARVSVLSDGSQANGFRFTPALSADGRVVAFFSIALNLVPGKTNPDTDVFLHDRQTRQTTRVGTSVTDATQSSRAPALSGDGLFVAYGGAPAPVGECPGPPGPRNSQIYVSDLVSHASLCASPGLPPGFPGGNANSVQPTLSGNGRVLAFVTLATNLVPDDPNRVEHIVVIGTDQEEFLPGDTIVTFVGLRNRGLNVDADLFAGVALPDGDTVLSFTPGGVVAGRVSDLGSLRPMATNVPLGSPFVAGAPLFTYTWTGSEPVGRYTPFFFGTVTGAQARGFAAPADILGLHMPTFGFAPGPSLQAFRVPIAGAGRRLGPGVPARAFRSHDGRFGRGVTLPPAVWFARR